MNSVMVSEDNKKIKKALAWRASFVAKGRIELPTFGL
jgi:hypothetical protein